MADQAMNRAPAGLVRLDQAKDYKIANDNPDPRGWDVFAGDTKVGEVDHLLADLNALKVRYLVVKVNDEIAGGQKDHRVLIPIGAARLDDDHDHVILPNASADMVAGLPAYRPGEPVTREYENTLRERMTGTPGAPSAPGADYYAGEQFDESRFFGTRGTGPDRVTRVPVVEEELVVGKRQRQAGEVDVHKRVETEHVSQPVTRMREDVEVERVPLRADEAAAPTEEQLQEGEIRVPIMEEEVVVEKRPVAKEEVVIRKHAVETTENVEADVRRERVDIEPQGDIKGRVERGGERERRPEDERRAP
jgi:uncharacterized protein (TIGR02271 family)